MTVREQGRAVVDYLIGHGLLTVVPASSADATAHLEAARRQARLAKDLERRDPDAAFADTYTALREPWTGVLVVQGLRPVVAEDHVAIAAALLGQLHPPLGRLLNRFDWIYRSLKAPKHPHAAITPRRTKRFP